MSNDEFATAADELHDAMRDLDRADAIAAACRGSGDPAALAWLAESLALRPDDLVLDVGGGTGGPSAWLQDHYGCRVVATDPVFEAVRVARADLGVPAAVSAGDALPVRPGVDAALCLGVISVVDDPARLLVEVARVTGRFGAIVWCSSGDDVVEAGGSRFLPVEALAPLLADSGWRIVCGPEAPTLPQPPPWRRAARATDTHDPDEEDVTELIDADRIHSRLLVCRTV